MSTPVKCLLTLLLSTAICLAAPKKSNALDVSGDNVQHVVVVNSVPFKLTATEGHDLYFWTVPDGVTVEKQQHVLAVTKVAKKGTYKFAVLCYTKKVDFDKKTTEVVKEELEVTINYGGLPTPGPTPNPDDNDPPTPTPDVKGPMRVMIIYEQADIPAMKKDPARREQADMLFSPAFKGALTDRADKNGPNKRGWVIWDKDVKGVEKADKFWQDAFARKRGNLPYIHIFKGDKPVHEGELPKTQKEALDLINKYAE